MPAGGVGNEANDEQLAVHLSLHDDDARRASRSALSMAELGRQVDDRQHGTAQVYHASHVDGHGRYSGDRLVLDDLFHAEYAHGVLLAPDEECEVLLFHCSTPLLDCYGVSQRGHQPFAECRIGVTG